MGSPVTTVTNLEPILQKIPYTDTTSLQAGEYGNPLILNNLFALLTLMIDRLQKTAASQADRLNFLTNWQQAYASKMNTIHVFTAGNGDGTGANTNTTNYISRPTVSSDTNTDDENASSDANTLRQGLNALNTNYSTNMTSQNNVISNDAKALQSAVNQTNDSVQAQSDMATSILQQLQTILTSIYQSA